MRIIGVSACYKAFTRKDNCQNTKQALAKRCIHYMSYWIKIAHFKSLMLSETITQ